MSISLYPPFFRLKPIRTPIRRCNASRWELHWTALEYHGATEPSSMAGGFNMLDHVTIGVTDIERSRALNGQAPPPLRIQRLR
jgi:hypothetical protein